MAKLLGHISKACPFCGSFELQPGGWRILCEGCGAEGPLGKSAEQAVDLWNARRKEACTHVWGTAGASATETNRAACLICGDSPAFINGVAAV